MQMWRGITFCRVRGAGSSLLARHRGFFNEIQGMRVMSNTCEVCLCPHTQLKAQEGRGIGRVALHSGSATNKVGGS